MPVVRRDADHHDPAPDAYRTQGGLQRSILASRLEGHVDRTPRVDPVGLTFDAGQSDVVGARVTSGRDTVWSCVARLDTGDAGRPRRTDDQQADRATAVDADVHTRANLSQTQRMESDPERLKQRDVVTADGVGHSHEQTLRPGHERAQSPVDRSMTAEGHPRAQVVVAGTAQVTFTAGVGRLDHDPLTRPRSRGDDTAHLVAQHQ